MKCLHCCFTISVPRASGHKYPKVLILYTVFVRVDANRFLSRLRCLKYAYLFTSQHVEVNLIISVSTQSVAPRSTRRKAFELFRDIFGLLNFQTATVVCLATNNYSSESASLGWLVLPSYYG